MIDDLTCALEPSERDFFSIIWIGDHFLKKIKNFLWELGHKAINTADRLQHRMPYMSLSPSWCIMCCANAGSRLFFLFIVLLLDNFGISFQRLLVGLLFCPITFWTSSTLLWWATCLMVVRRLFGWLFIGLSFGRYGPSVIGVYFKTLFHLLVLFWTLFCPQFFIDAKLGTLLRTLAYWSQFPIDALFVITFRYLGFPLISFYQ